MVRPVLRTARLELQPMTPQHLPLLVALDSDAEVLRHILGRARSEDEAREFWAPKCADTTSGAVGLGWRVGFLDRRAGNSTRTCSERDFVGWWTLSPGAIDTPTPDVADRAEAGWRLTRRHWGRGLATEGAAALFDHGFRTVGLDAIWAETTTANLDSQGVMRRLGMHHAQTEQDAVIYEIASSDWSGPMSSSGMRAGGPVS